MPKKCCVLYFGTRGAGPALTYSMSCEIEGAGILKSIICSNEQELLSNFESKFDGKVITLDIPRNIVGCLNVFKFFEALFAVNSQIKGSNYVVIPMLHPWSVAMLPFFYKKIKVLFAIHDAVPHEGDRKVLVSFFNWIIGKFAWRVIFFTKSQLRYLYPEGGEKPVCLHLPSFRHYSMNGRRQKKYDFLFFGRLEPYKGLDLLKEAFKLVREKHPEATLCIAGKPGKGFLEADWDFSGIIKNISYIPDESVPDIVGAARAVVLPYITATQSGVMTLASDFGVACISTPIDGLREQAAYTGKVFFSESASSESLAKSMSVFLESFVDVEYVSIDLIESGVVEALK